MSVVNKECVDPARGLDHHKKILLIVHSAVPQPFQKSYKIHSYFLRNLADR